MYIKRFFSPFLIYFFTWRILLFSLVTGTAVVLMYQLLGWRRIAIPWLPVSLIGTAVAFYVGFKNNSSYDRQWEARKIWGGIVNLSRAFAASVRAFVTADFADAGFSEADIRNEQKVLIYRHIAWLYALKGLMWQRTAWEHQRNVNTWYRNYFEKKFGFVSAEEELRPFLSGSEFEWLKHRKNAAVQLLDRQSQHLLELKRKGLLDDFRHMELQKFLTELYGEQGRTERIKNFPLPRQYATTSTIFISLFSLLLPFGMITEFAKLGESSVWLLIPFNMAVGWVFGSMEYVGDYSENPFEGLANDVPIFTIIRNIEIDLKDMLGESNLPEKVQPVQGVLL